MDTDKNNLIVLENITKLILRKGVNERIATRNKQYGLLVDNGIAYNKAFKSLLLGSEIEHKLDKDKERITLKQNGAVYEAPAKIKTTALGKEWFIDLSKIEKTINIKK